MFEALLHAPFWVAPILIFSARLVDVTLATVRIIFVSRGLRYAAPFIGFFEILIWLVAIGQVMQHLDRPLNYLAYAAGFAGGTFLGIFVEERLAVGLVAVRIITPDDATELIDRLRDERFGVTSFAARGIAGRVRLLYSVARRRDLVRLTELVREVHPKAFVSVTDVRTAQEGFLPTPLAGTGTLRWGLLRRSK
jgi:uncharacterized protein YebE (UPF0316 family)